MDRIYVWWALLDSNQQPTDYESAALTVVLRALALKLSQQSPPESYFPRCAAL